MALCKTPTTTNQRRGPRHDDSTYAISSRLAQAPPACACSRHHLATVTRGDGTKQVSYNGHPLYYCVGDHAAGDTSGQNLDQFGGSWYVLSPLGTQIGN